MCAQVCSCSPSASFEVSTGAIGTPHLSKVKAEGHDIQTAESTPQPRRKDKSCATSTNFYPFGALPEQITCLSTVVRMTQLEAQEQAMEQVFQRANLFLARVLGEPEQQIHPVDSRQTRAPSSRAG